MFYQPQSVEEKLLGITFDSELKSGKHITGICNKNKNICSVQNCKFHVTE